LWDLAGNDTSGLPQSFLVTSGGEIIFRISLPLLSDTGDLEVQAQMQGVEIKQQ